MSLKVSNLLKKSLKNKFRIIDLRRQLFDLIGVVKAIDYDPNRNARIAFVFYKKLGLFTYILATEGLKVGANIKSYNYIKNDKLLKIGDSCFLKYIPLSLEISNIEMRPGAGASLVRAAGTKAKIMRKYEKSKFVGLKLPSKQIQYIKENCIGTIGRVSNMKFKFIDLNKAGKNRNLGIRPKVRGVAMNPIDHPHGGGEGKKLVGDLLFLNGVN